MCVFILTKLIYFWQINYSFANKSTFLQKIAPQNIQILEIQHLKYIRHWRAFCNLINTTTNYEKNIDYPASGIYLHSVLSD